MILKAKDFERVVRKLGMRKRNSGDRHAWFEHEGKVITRTKRSNTAGDLPFAHTIRQQLKLTEDDLRDLVACPLDRDGYVAILRRRGLIDDQSAG